MDQIYLSTDPVLDGADVGVSCVPYSPPLPAGESYWQTNLVRLPLTQSGDYYLILRTDDYGYLQEVDHNNNVLTVPLTFPHDATRPGSPGLARSRHSHRIARTRPLPWHGVSQTWALALPRAITAGRIPCS